MGTRLDFSADWPSPPDGWPRTGGRLPRGGNGGGDWLTARAWDLFRPTVPAAEGAGAILLRSEPPISNCAITEPVLYRNHRSRRSAAVAAWENLPAMAGAIFLWTLRIGSRPAARKRPRLRSPRQILGEGFGAAGPWSCVAAVHAVARAGCCAAVRVADPICRRWRPDSVARRSRWAEGDSGGGRKFDLKLSLHLPRSAR